MTLQGKFEAKKHAIRQTQDGWVVSLVVHPSDMSPEFAAAPLGTQLMIAYCEYSEEAVEALAPARSLPPNPAPSDPPGPVGESVITPVVTAGRDARSERAREAYRANDAMGQAVQRCSMMCKEAAFARFMENRLGFSPDRIATPETCADFLRRHLGITSRRAIGTDEVAYWRFLELETDFKIATGQMAEPR